MATEERDEYNADGQRWGLWERKAIGPAEDPMLVRYRVIRTPWFGLFIHKLLREDRSRHPHDHPWPFVSAVLVGGYREELAERFQHRGTRATFRERGPGSTRALPATGLWHRFVHLHRQPTWTLVLVGRKCNQWGFLLADGTTVDAEAYAPETYQP